MAATAPLRQEGAFLAAKRHKRLKNQKNLFELLCLFVATDLGGAGGGA